MRKIRQFERLVAALLVGVMLLLCSLDANSIRAKADTQNNVFKLKAYCLAVGSSFDMKYYLELSDAVKNDTTSYVRFTINGLMQKVYPSIDAKGQAVYTCKVTAKQINDTIKAELYYNGDLYLISYYSVKEYMDAILKDSKYASAADVARAVLNYGSYAQQYFNYHTGSLANKNMYEIGQNPIELLSDSTIVNSVKTPNTSQFSNSDFDYIGASLKCDSEIVLNLYFYNKFSLSKDEIEKKYSCSVANCSYPFEISVSGSFFCMSLKNIPAVNLDKTYTFIMQSTSSKTTIEYGPMSYVKEAMTSSNDKLKNLCKAIYLYNKATKEYVANRGQAEENVAPEDTDDSYPLFEVPYISTYYFNPKPTVNDEIEIPFYITDSKQSEYMLNDDSVKLDLVYEVDGYEYTLKNLSLGDNVLKLGKLSEGIHTISMQAYDNNSKLSSPKLNNELWVVSSYELDEGDIYYMTEDDLVTYNINCKDSTDPVDLENTRDGLTKLFADKQKDYKKIVLLKGTYRINGKDARETCITIPSYFTVDMNGSTFKLDTITENCSGCIVFMNDAIDAHLENGTLEGDRLERQQLNLERNGWGEGINTVLIKGGKYCSLDNLNIINTTGHTVWTLPTTNYFIQKKLVNYTNTAIVNGVESASDRYSTCGMVDLTDYINWDPNEDYFYIGYPAGYRGIRTNSAIIYVTFYNSNQQFIKTETCCQFRKIAIPEGAQYIRVTVSDNEIGQAQDQEGLYIYVRRLGDYHSITNITFDGTRTCAIAPTTCNNLLIENVTYNNCGDSITPLPVDFEDGWDECQDVYYRNNEVINKASKTTATIVDNAGFNHVYENCKNHQIYLNARLTGGVVRNMNDQRDTVSCDLGQKKCNSFGRIYNNNCASITFTCQGGDKDIVTAKVKNSTIYTDRIPAATLMAPSKYVIYDGCTFPNYGGSRATFYNCVIQPAAKFGDDLFFYNCTFKALDGSPEIRFDLSTALDGEYTKYDAVRLFEGCKFEGKVILGHENFHTGVFRKCTFEDVKLKVRLDSSYSDIVFEGCTINSSAESFLETGQFNYDVGNINIKFRDCIITHTGTNLVGFYSSPSNNSQVIFENCTINKTQGYLIKWLTNYERSKKLEFISVDVVFQGGTYNSLLGVDNSLVNTIAKVKFTLE